MTEIFNFFFFGWFRYIYKLYDLHKQADSYTEAGFTLKLYADTLCWNKETLTFLPGESAGQPEWQRKENLYLEVQPIRSNSTMLCIKPVVSSLG